MSAEANGPSYFDMAQTYFPSREMEIDSRLQEHRRRLGALVGLDESDPLVVRIADRLHGDRRDEDVAAWLGVQTEAQFGADAKIAVDDLTGMLTYSEFERWADGVYLLRGLAEKRRPAEGVKNPRSYTKIRGDIDDFKWPNDFFGEDVGDLILKAAAKEILGSIRKGDNIVVYRERLGGDEFGISVADLSEDEAKGFWARLQGVQMRKVDRRNQIRQLARAARDVCPDPEKYKNFITVNEVVTAVGDLTVSHTSLSIGDQFICNVSELVVIDYGVAHGLVEDESSMKKIDDAADKHKTLTKDTVHNMSGGAYRKSE